MPSLVVEACLLSLIAGFCILFMGVASGMDLIKNKDKVSLKTWLYYCISSTRVSNAPL